MVIHDVIVYYHHNQFFIPSQDIISPLFLLSSAMIREETKQNKTVYIVSFFWKASELRHNYPCVGAFSVTEKF